MVLAHILRCGLATLESNGLHQLFRLGLLIELRRRIPLLGSPEGLACLARQKLQLAIPDVTPAAAAGPDATGPTGWSGT